MMAQAPQVSGLYRVSFYDEFANAVRVAYLTIPLYAYIKGKAEDFVTGYLDRECQYPRRIGLQYLMEDFQDEDSFEQT